jgi:hypothetical protein
MGKRLRDGASRELAPMQWRIALTGLFWRVRWAVLL